VKNQSKTYGEVVNTGKECGSQSQVVDPGEGGGRNSKVVEEKDEQDSPDLTDGACLSQQGRVKNLLIPQPVDNETPYG